MGTENPPLNCPLSVCLHVCHRRADRLGADKVANLDRGLVGNATHERAYLGKPKIQSRRGKRSFGGVDCSFSRATDASACVACCLSLSSWLCAMAAVARQCGLETI
jgi:hypothetical protein